MNNLMLTFLTPPRELNGVCRAPAGCLGTEPTAAPGRANCRVAGGVRRRIHGPHMADVIAHTGLDIETIANLHCEPLYPVYALGQPPRLLLPRRHGPTPGHAPSPGAGAGYRCGLMCSSAACRRASPPRPAQRLEHHRPHRDGIFDPAQTPPAILRPGDFLRLRIERIIR